MIDMKQKSVSAFYFDKENKFAGFDVIDHKKNKSYSYQARSADRL